MEIEDTSWEHFQHNTFDTKCPECFKENRIIKSHKMVNRDSDREELGLNPLQSAGRISPWDRDPLN